MAGPAYPGNFGKVIADLRAEDKALWAAVRRSAPSTIPAPSGVFFEFTQASPASTWVIVHNLGRRVSVTVYDTDGNPYLADVHTNSPDSTSVIFTTPTAGSALVL